VKNRFLPPHLFQNPFPSPLNHTGIWPPYLLPLNHEYKKCTSSAVVSRWMEDNLGLDRALGFPWLGFTRPPAFKN